MNMYRQSIHLLLLLPALALVSACSDNPVDANGFTGKAGGCSNFLVYKFNSVMTTAVVVSARGSQLTFDRTPRNFALPNTGFDVRIEHFSGSAYAHYCDDVLDDGEPSVTHMWSAVSGTVRVAAGDTLAVDPWSTTYKVSVSLHDAVFRDKTGEEVFIKELDFGEIVVGWLPG